MHQPFSKAVKVLLVNADIKQGSAVAAVLTEAGYVVKRVDSSRQAIIDYRKSPSGICLIYEDPPKIDICEAVSAIRRKSDMVPIVILGKSITEGDRLNIYKAGVDFIANQTINIQELLLRIQVFLKRTKVPAVVPVTSRQFIWGDTCFDVDASALKRNGGTVYQLSPRERDVLKMLCDFPNRILRREEILYHVWGKDDFFFGRSMDVVVTKIRRSLAHIEMIELETLTGVGFRLNIYN